ncbi:hypothetical protein CE143_10225 [Photorhabdus luminescens]|uniref:Uncharacterized protein n=1 Tax=Photorhabdus akhurstii TaxID=171438 RepID=A0ABX8LSH9_9GAMM|nr:hypothetical protein [Photorhabdus akhurstii]QXF33492.1 hypothetical protein B0X70_10315 [Photorhabdus akhurstii]UJD75289.1 hypothetical protein CE143_10225 [Photorhabdus luminescens]
MKKNYAISPQIINTIEMSNESWGIQDSSSNFIYCNSATKKLTRGFKQPFSYEEFYDHSLSQAMG